MQRLQPDVVDSVYPIGPFQVSVELDVRVALATGIDGHPIFAATDRRQR